MTSSNWLADAFGNSVPVIGAPMAGPGGGALARAITGAGALGMIGVNDKRDRSWIEAEAAVAGEGGAAYGVGLMAWALAGRPEQLDTVLELRPALVSVSFGDYAEPVRLLRDAGVRTATQVGNLTDLEAALAAEVDLVVARGAEAGGHGRNDLGTLPLLQLVLAEVGDDVPVLAAGGIIDHRGVAAVLAAGAVGAWVGTAFLACAEAANTSAARQRLIKASQTGYGRVFDVAQQVDWPPEFGGRALRNEYFDTWVGHEEDLTPEKAAEFARLAADDRDFEIAHLYAGEGVAGLREERTAAEVVASLTPLDWASN